MNRYISILCSAVFAILVALPCQLSAASITETTAAIGKGCVASDIYSTAMGLSTTAVGKGSTAGKGGIRAVGLLESAFRRFMGREYIRTLTFRRMQSDARG